MGFLRVLAPFAFVLLIVAGCVQAPEPGVEPRDTDVAALGLRWQPSDVGLSIGARFDGPEQNITEPEVAVNPLDPNNVLVFAIDQSARNVDDSFATNRGFRSADGGRTWQDLGPMPLTPGGTAPDSGDPVVVFDEAGVAYFVSLVTPPGESRYIYLYRSRDGGVTWEQPDVVHLPEENRALQMCMSVDKEWITAGPNPGELVLTSTLAEYTCDATDTPAGSLEPVGIQSISLFSTRSTDEGRTWSPRAEIWSGYGLGSMPVILEDGTIAVAFWATVAETSEACPSVVGAAVTAWGGGPFGAVVVASSKDLGATWTHVQHETCVSDASLEGSFFPSLPAFALDRDTNRLFLAYPNYRPDEERTTIELRTSKDGGYSWSQAIDMTPALEAGLPTLTASNGTASLVYVTMGAQGTDAWIRRSFDEGQTWSDPMRLSSETADRAGGDYIGVDMAGNRLVAVWADARDGPLEIRSRSGVVE